MESLYKDAVTVDQLHQAIEEHNQRLVDETSK